MYQIGIVGMGTIGLKLVEYFAEKSFEVIAFTRRDCEQKKMQFVKNVEKSAKYDQIPLVEVERIIGRVHFTDQYDSFAGTDLIIDCSKERYEAKKEVFCNLVNKYGTDLPLVASTTSSLALDRLCRESGLNYLIGMHFFNPPTKMKLLELSIYGDIAENARKKLYQILNLVDDKVIIELPVIQGYIVNRILFVYINYAIKFMREQKLDALTIDKAMRTGTNVPMGPIELSDYIGNDITYQILDEFYRVLGEEVYKPDIALSEMVNSGCMGRKSKKGFYQY